MRTSATLAGFTLLATLASFATPALAEESPAARDGDSAPVDGGPPSAPAREPAEAAAVPAPAPPTAARVSPSAPALPPAPPEAPSPPLVWHPNTALLATGLSLVSVGYGPNFVAAVPSAGGGVLRAAQWWFTAGLVCWTDKPKYACDAHHGAVQLLIPIVGPILFAEDHPRDTFLNERGRPLSPAVKGLLYTSAALQAAGIGALVASAVLGESTRAPAKADAGPALLVAPLGVPGSVGLELGVQRW
jgi:hypothetical protein